MRKLYGRLIIRVESATNLPNSDYFSGLSDPYCVVLLDGTEIGRTEVCQDEANPVWNQDILLNLNGEGETITFQIWDADTARTDDLLGTFEVPVTSIATTKKTDKEQLSGTTADLKNAAGESTGSLTYSMRLREFGGEFATFKNDGTKRALQIGINYTNKQLGKGGVTGCHQDVDILGDLLIDTFGFTRENMTVLRDDDESTIPTRRNIERAIKEFVRSVRPGDSLVFQFSGHGGQQKDKTGDEKDGMDETILPYDHDKAGQITDDDLYKMLVAPLPRNVLLTCIMDCCHSGTSIDLPFVHVLHTSEGEVEEGDHFGGFVEREAPGADNDVVIVGEEPEESDPVAAKLKALSRGSKGARYKRKARRRRKTASTSNKGYDNTSDASVVMISGCLDHQTSAGTSLGGAMVLAFSKAIEDSNANISYKDLLVKMTEILKHRGFSQVPQLSTARPFNLDCQVKI